MNYAGKSLWYRASMQYYKRGIGTKIYAGANEYGKIKYL
jgi:hypothetical protein